MFPALILIIKGLKEIKEIKENKRIRDYIYIYFNMSVSHETRETYRIWIKKRDAI